MRAEGLPLVTICVPTYQAQATLARTLASLQRQSYAHIEILIVDNASSDQTVEIARRLGEGDPRVKVVTSATNVGAEGNFRRCVEIATGDIVGLLHADDLYDERMIEKQVDYLLRHPQSAAVFVEAFLIDADDRQFGDRRTPAMLAGSGDAQTHAFWPVFRAVLRHHNFLMTPSVLVRRDVYKQLRLFDHARFGSSADLDVWLQIMNQAPVGILRERLMSYRISPDQGSVTLIRQRTDRADFFKVLDAWMEKPAVAAGLTPQDRRNYAWLDKSDRLARALASAEQGALADVPPLLASLYTLREFVIAIFQRPRAAVCAVLTVVMRLRLALGWHPSRGPLVDRLRRLARI